MAKRAHPLDRMYIASPCSLDWEQMTGDDRARFCGACNKRVYNISRMTRKEAEALIESAQGRLCAKFERRADGTILTADAPAASLGFRWRMPRFAGAVVSAALSLSVSAAAFPSRASGPVSAFQKQKGKKPSEPSTSRITYASLSGTIYDPIQAVIAGAEISLENESTRQKLTTTSDEEGKFRFQSVESSSYTLTVTSPGFRIFGKANVVLKPVEELHLDVVMEVGTVGGADFFPEEIKPTPIPKALLTPFKKLVDLFKRK